MHTDLPVLIATALSLGFFHTILGPDHYVPFIAMAKTGGWSPLKTTVVTVLSGLGHVLSSIILGAVGIALGLAVTSLERVESLRGQIAAWGLIGFGLVYLVWGIVHAVRGTPHTHCHPHLGDAHQHIHTHEDGHIHVHAGEKKKSITPWVLFAIFLFGPCEPLIPLLMYPAATHSPVGVVVVALVFGSVTILTMTTIVLAAYYGVVKLPGKGLERYAHAIAGATVLLCGLAVTFLGL